MREQLKHLGSQSDVVITTTKLEEGIPQDGPKLVLKLTVEYFKGKVIDQVIH